MLISALGESKSSNDTLGTGFLPSLVASLGNGFICRQSSLPRMATEALGSVILDQNALFQQMSQGLLLAQTNL